jgi:predicted dehydrogenase
VTESKTFGVAVVGAGAMGLRHLGTVSGIEDFQARAVADVDPARAEEAARHGEQRVRRGGR